MSVCVDPGVLQGSGCVGVMTSKQCPSYPSALCQRYLYSCTLFKHTYIGVEGNGVVDSVHGRQSPMLLPDNLLGAERCREASHSVHQVMIADLLPIGYPQNLPQAAPSGEVLDLASGFGLTSYVESTPCFFGNIAYMQRKAVCPERRGQTA